MAKPTATQKTAFKRLQSVDTNAEVRWDDQSGSATRVRGVLSEAATGPPEVVAQNFLASNKGLFALKTPQQELAVKGVTTDRVGNRHVRFQQMYKGLPVFGSELIVQVNGENRVRGVNSKYSPGIDLPDKPRVTAKQAEQTILKHSRGEKLPHNDQPVLLVLPYQGTHYLAWQTTVSGTDKALDGSDTPAMWVYFVDAVTGKVLWRYNNEQTHTRTTGTGTGKYAGSVTLNTTHDHSLSTYTLEDQWVPTTARVITHDADNGFPPKPISKDGNNNWSAAAQGAEVDCHYYTRLVFDYFLVVHGRNSYDDAGADMHIYAHCGTNWNNASWNGSFVKMGDGDGTDHDSFCTLDIVAHEWTHAVTEHTANLIYANESGALNESMSDVFAALIDGDWLHGEDNWLKSTAPAGRNLADPTNGGQYDGSSQANALQSVLDGHQPDHISDMWTWEVDHGGVHVNSGIMNKVAYLIATGGTHNGVTVCEGLGRDVLGRLYYQTLTSHLTASSDFEDMRDAVLDSLDDLYAGDARYNRWRASVINAFAAVGIGSAVDCPLTCWVAPVIVVCPPAPLIACPPAPLVACPPAPAIACPPAPLVACPPAAAVACPPAPVSVCPPGPMVACPPAPIVACPPGPAGCLPGPDPIPFQPSVKKKK